MLELAGIETVKVQGERTAPGGACHSSFGLTAGYKQDGTLIHYRFEVTAHFIGEDDAALGNAAATVLVTIRANEPVDEASVERFGETSAARIAYPFLSESIASIAQRIGFTGVVLPAMGTEDC